MRELNSTQIAKAEEKRVNSFLKTLELGDGGKVTLLKTNKDQVPLPLKKKRRIAF
jgi:hypothetical protein